MSPVAEWITAVGTAAAGVGVIGVFIQVRLAVLQTRYDHDRSRRERAVDAINAWAAAGHVPVADRFYDAFLHPKTRDNRLVATIIDGQAAVVPGTDAIQRLLRACLEPNVLTHVKHDSDGYHLECSISERLAQKLYSHLDSLESALIAWKHNVADRRILQEEFKTAFEPFKMRQLVDAVSPKDEIYFPGIDEFLKAVLPPAVSEPSLGPIASPRASG